MKKQTASFRLVRNLLLGIGMLGGQLWAASAEGEDTAAPAPPTSTALVRVVNPRRQAAPIMPPRNLLQKLATARRRDGGPITVPAESFALMRLADKPTTNEPEFDQEFAYGSGERVPHNYAQEEDEERQKAADMRQKLYEALKQIATDTIPEGGSTATNLPELLQRASRHPQYSKTVSKAIQNYLSYLSPEERKTAHANIKKHFPIFGDEVVAPGRFDSVGRFFDKATKPLPRLAFTAADAYFDRKSAHEEADVLSETNPDNMRRTTDGDLARAGQFGLRKAFALKDIAKTLQSSRSAPLGRALQDPNWGRGTALARLAGMAANVLYQGWTRKRAQLTEEEQQELAAYNHHVGVSDEIKALQEAIKSNANWRAGIHVASDGVLGQIGHPKTDPLYHGTGLWHEFMDMRHRYRVANAYDKVRARVKEWREENPDLQLPQNAAGQPDGMQDLMQMLMGGQGGQGGMDPQQLQQLMGSLGGMA